MTTLENRNARVTEDSIVLEISLSPNTGEWLEEVRQELAQTGLALGKEK